jgi:hypothetical protein
VVALVVGLILLAVPLYLWRRPSGQEHAASASTLAAPGPGLSAADGSAPGGAASDGARGDERVRLAAVQRIKCSASGAVRGQSGSLCDALPFFEEGLMKAIRATLDCAPKTGKEGSINYVLKVDFNHRSLHVFPGASGTWKGPQARRATACVKRALPPPQWETAVHQYRHYVLSVLATYPAPGAAPPPAAGTTGPLFE